MATWHPPIPTGKLYSEDALKLGSGLALLVWCYDGIQRDGHIDIELNKLPAEFGVSYRTVKDWWASLRTGPFFSKLVDRGHLGWRVWLSEDWIDWHVMKNNYPEGQETTLGSSPDEGQDSALDDAQSPLKVRSKSAQGQKNGFEQSAYKEDHHLIESSSSGGDGGGQKSRSPPHVRYLFDRNMGAAKEFADLDPDTAIRDFDARIKAGQSPAHIVRAWRLQRPTPEDYFGKPPPQNSTGGPRPEKKSALSREELAALAAGK